MSAAGQSVFLPEALLEEAARHAKLLGVSTQEWVYLALEERMRLEEQDEAVWQARAARASGRALTEILAGSHDNPPDPGDELPEGWTPLK
jgi:hypothetical protein